VGNVACPVWQRLLTVLQVTLLTIHRQALTSQMPEKLGFCRLGQRGANFGETGGRNGDILATNNSCGGKDLG